MEREEHTEPGRRTHRRRAHRWLAIVLFGIASGVAVLRTFPPGIHAFYPECPFYRATGLLCPGCGATRALAALLRGHLAEAVHWNALVIAVLPFALVLAAYAYRRAIRGERAWPAVPPSAIAVALAITVAFAVARNLR